MSYIIIFIIGVILGLFLPKIWSKIRDRIEKACQP